MVEITSPRNDDMVTGVVVIEGQAVDRSSQPDLEPYTPRIRPRNSAEEVTEWMTAQRFVGVPVESGELGRWDTGPVADGATATGIAYRIGPASLIQTIGGSR